MKPLINLKSFLAVLLILIVPAALLVAYFRDYSPGAGGHEHSEKGKSGGGAMKMDGDKGEMKPGGEDHAAMGHGDTAKGSDKGAMKPAADSNATKEHDNKLTPQGGQKNSQPQAKTSQPSTAQAHPKQAAAKSQSRATFAHEQPRMAMFRTPPGIPGASHLYHLGATGFYLDHTQHLTLNIEQKKKLNQIREQARLNKASADRKWQEAEQQLWKLTAVEQPDTAQIETKVREIEKLHIARRLAFIRSVGEAANVLTDEQTKILLGTATAVTPDAKPKTPGSKPTAKPAAEPAHPHKP